jgi:hypothetical protein
VARTHHDVATNSFGTRSEASKSSMNLSYWSRPSRRIGHPRDHVSIRSPRRPLSVGCTEQDLRFKPCPALREQARAINSPMNVGCPHLIDQSAEPAIRCWPRSRLWGQWMDRSPPRYSDLQCSQQRQSSSAGLNLRTTWQMSEYFRIDRKAQSSFQSLPGPPRLEQY